jgi:outer membrane protein OmpA-like peptidoglycan-associated protein
MKRCLARSVFSIALIALATLASACATKNWVREQLGTSEGRLTQKVDTQEAKLRETSDRTAANTQALEATDRRIQGLDSRLGEVSGVATGAKKDAETVANAQRDAEAAFNQRFANRNRYAVVDTKTVYFDFAKADIRDQEMSELEDVAKALKDDPNAAVELQGFADARGSDHYNYQLTRERVEAVTRYLVQRHGIDLRRVYAVGMGKDPVAAGEKRPNKETLAKSRRVELRVMAPQS